MGYVPLKFWTIHLRRIHLAESLQMIRVADANVMENAPKLASPFSMLEKGRKI